MTQLLESLSSFIAESLWLAPFLALFAGMLTSLTPCSLSSIPLIIGLTGGASDTKKAFRLSVVFALGSAITFTALGIAASLAGQLIGASSRWWYLLLGAFMVLMALQTWEIFQIIPQRALSGKSRLIGYPGAFVAGIAGGIFASPCATPVLVALLAIVAQKGSLLWGAFLLLLYSIGHGVLAVVAGTSIGFVRKLSKSPSYAKANTVFKLVMGSLILLLGFYLLYLGF